MRKKRLIVFPSWISTPHYETDLEIAINHAQRGWDVYVAHCRGELNSCMTNREQDPIVCLTCSSRISQGLAIARKAAILKTLRIRNLTVAALPNLPSWSSAEELRQFMYGEYEVGRAVFSTISFILGEHTFDIDEYQPLVKREIRTACSVIEWLESDILQLEPHRMVILNGRFTVQGMTVGFCKKFGIEYLTHERAGVLGRYKLRINTVIHDIDADKTDIEKVWSESGRDEEEKKRIGASFFTERVKGLSQGWHSFKTLQKDRLLPVDFDQTKRNIAIFPSSWEEHVTFPQWYGNPIYEDDQKALEEILEDRRLQDCVFWIRLHPNLVQRGGKQVKITATLGNTYPNARIIDPQSPVDSNALADASEKVIVFNSTMGVESAFWGKPVVVIGRAVYEDLEIAYHPADHEAVVKHLDSQLTPKPKEGAYKFGYWQKMYGEPYHHFRHTAVSEGYLLGQRIKNSRVALLKKVLGEIFRGDLRKVAKRRYNRLVLTKFLSLLQREKVRKCGTSINK